jgi:hypothetical protein
MSDQNEQNRDVELKENLEEASLTPQAQLEQLLAQKSQEEWLDHVASWLELQRLCGAEAWLMKDSSVWSSRLPQPQSSSPVASSSVVQRGERSSFPPTSSSKEVPLFAKRAEEQRRAASGAQEGGALGAAKKSATPLQERELGGSWGALGSRFEQGSGPNRPFSYLQISKGAEGMRETHDYFKEHGHTGSSFGRGPLDASVVLIEWHTEPMNSEAFIMLKNMRERVLNLEKNQLFWLPFPRSENCNPCTQIFRAQLSCLSPKAVLLMGAMPISYLTFVDQAPGVGERAALNQDGREIPLLRTENPMTIVRMENPEEQRHAKRAVLRHLQAFHALLAELRIVKRIRR